MAQTVADTPALLALWDAAENPEPASAALAHGHRPMAWRCPKGHTFRLAPRLLLRNPVCKLCGVASRGRTFADERPGLAPLWHPERNGDLRPDAVDATHAGAVWWRCPRGHEFQRAPLLMLRESDCPSCALAKTSLAALFPELAKEWSQARNGDVTPDGVDPDHLMTVWWTCPKGHDYQASVRSRARTGRRCPTCHGSWPIEHIRQFVQALLGHVRALNPSELFALAMQAGLHRDAGARPFLHQLTSGRFPLSELEKFARGEPSAVDEGPLVLRPTDPKAPKEERPLDPWALPPAPTPGLEPGDVDVSLAVDAVTQASAEAEADLPVVQTTDALRALGNVLVASADAETVKFLLDSAKAKLWRHAYVDPVGARAQAAAFEGDTYAKVVRDRFLAEFDEAQALELPAGYRFRPKGSREVVPPNLMQRRVAVCVRSERRFGNWSGMGAGKTLSAILATRLVGAGLTVICCPNAVVENWATEIRGAFDGCEVQAKTWTPTWKHPLASAPRYLVMNFEQFQQSTSEASLVAFLAENAVDFVVVDEIHYTKQREPGPEVTKRKRLVQALVLEAGKKNADVCVLGMSGTPVINTLQEGKSLVELITGHTHDDLEVKPTVQNCMRLYQRLVTLGTRWKPNYAMALDVKQVEVDCGADLDAIRRVARGTILELEQVLTELRLPTILANIQPGEKVVVYTHYVDLIAKTLLDAMKAEGLRAGLLTGDTDVTDLEEFLKPNGRVDVLIASSRIGTGVDGVQHVCRKLIINALPWTNAEYEQLVGRLYRQGSRFRDVEVVIPVTFAMVNGERWSYCESKLHRIAYKKSIADAAVDGVVPEGNLRTPAQAQQDIMSWLARLEDGAIATIERRRIEIPLSGEPAEVDRRVRRYGDFSAMNNRWYGTSSDKTHARLEANAEEWAHYHTMYRALREKWPVVPFEEEIRWLSERSGYVVGDFGCGEALIAARVGHLHEVHSFDHVAINESVTACDIAAVGLGDGTLDVAIFCLSLMGTNFTDYLREAHRCLRLDGYLHLWEPASYFEDVGAFVAGLERLGFHVVAPRQDGQFLRVEAVKATNRAAGEVVLRFRGGG